MPELPEVEVTRLSFADRIAGAQILDLRMGKPLRWPLGIAPAKLRGQQLQGVSRRGKYLILQLAPSGVVLIHLGMSGSLQFRPAPEPVPCAGVHDHMDLFTNRGHLRLHDPRRFGAVVWGEGLDSPHIVKLLGKLGVEPFSADFTAYGFWRGLKTKRSAIKQVLLAGELVVGVGNIYASEALFLAGIRPTARAHTISQARAAKLHAAIVEVLGQAVAAGGSSLRDFSNAHGQQGHFQTLHLVYDREGQACRICSTKITLLRQGQRSSYFCRLCQSA
jgi:formamidopyrimidine-DNA glycosylase